MNNKRSKLNTNNISNIHINDNSINIDTPIITEHNNSQFIIESKQFVLTKIISIILTTIMSLYSFTVFYFFISAIFNINNDFISPIKIALKTSNDDIKSFLLLSLFIFLINFAFLFIWKTYNKKRYGNLNRRTMPSDTTDEDMLSLDLASIEDYKKLQNNDLIIFEKNPIKDLDEIKD